jgi:hypothetical protein
MGGGYYKMDLEEMEWTGLLWLGIGAGGVCW